MGRKRRFSGQFGGVLRGLDLVWESATPPTHIWERSPKKNGLFWKPPLMLIIHSIIAFISGAGCPGSGSAGVFMFWKFPESVKCARLRLAHLTNSGNFQNKNTPAEPLPRHPAPEIKAISELSALPQNVNLLALSDDAAFNL